MIRERTDLPSNVYPNDPWAIVEESFAPRFLYLMETIFAQSNGHIGVRGTVDDGDPVHVHGTFVNGYHETWPIVHPESAYGFATTGQTIVDVPDASVTELAVDGEVFSLTGSRISSYRRWLDFRTGILERRIEWTTESGIGVKMHSRRLVSLTRRRLMGYSLDVETDVDTTVVITSRLVNRQDEGLEERVEDTDPRRARVFGHRVLVPEAATLEGNRFVQAWRTAHSGLGLMVGIDHAIDAPEPTLDVRRDADDFAMTFALRARADESIHFERFAAYETGDTQESPELRSLVEADLESATQDGFSELAAEQRVDLDAFWERADVEVDAGPEIQRAVRWSLFQLHQASARLEGMSIPAKGLTGQAYDGNYFWDIEIYVMPFLVYTNPTKAAEVLRFRHSLLDYARQRAEVLGHDGAMFPWRTISGEEASAYFPAGTAQYHINADIVYALGKYLAATGDDELLWSIGVEMAIETARMWHDLGFTRGNRFHIHGVTGPDEYSALVNDNAFTNAMARMNLRFAADSVARMRSERPDRWAELEAQLEYDDQEEVEWRVAADNMFIPFDHVLGITEQDDAFLMQERWDFASVPSSKYPLLLHYHPLTLYRFQVIKQADVVLADFLLGNEFPEDLKQANFDYYDPLTTGDSSLSASVQSIMAAEIGYEELALHHFQHALFMDLADLAGNTTDGVHMASAGGVWMALVYGFAGFRDTGGRITFHPSLPHEWGRMSFRLLVRGATLSVELERGSIRLTSDTETLEVGVRDQVFEVRPGDPVTVEL